MRESKSSPVPASSNQAASSAQAVFHAGELRAQQQAGVLEQVAGIGPRLIRDFMPEQHREFFAQLPFLIVGSQDAQGQPWASILTGAPGFLSTPDERQLQIDALPHASDPLHDNLHAGGALGLLGIAPHTRRRNRANGVVGTLRDDGLTVDIRQSFGNCPKYIQAREPQLRAQLSTMQAQIEQGEQLNPAMLDLIAAADTFFIATAADASDTQQATPHGVDVSHRGGHPGFVRCDDAVTLTVPDFVGNSLFNTIGNLLLHPRAGLLFVDFNRGDLLYLAVHAEVIWRGPEVDAIAGAQRLLRFHLTQARLVRDILPLQWGAVTPSPFLPPLAP